jgi:hypothetical protein
LCGVYEELYTEEFKIEGLVEAREVTGLELKGVNRTRELYA